MAMFPSSDKFLCRNFRHSFVINSMKFMLLLRGEDKFLQLSPSEAQAVIERYMAWAQKLGEAGLLVDGDSLENGGRILSSENGVITDGPFVESKDMAGGYFILNADSLEHAVEIAREAPTFSYGGAIEIRPTGHGS